MSRTLNISREELLLNLEIDNKAEKENILILLIEENK